MSFNFDETVFSILTNITYYFEVLTYIKKSLTAYNENKQLFFNFVSSNGTIKVYNVLQLKAFFNAGVIGYPASIYSDPIDQEIYTIFLCRDFFATLYSAGKWSKTYHNEGKQFIYKVTLPPLLYPDVPQRSKNYNRDQYLNLFNAAVVATYRS
jgi:hypothetical protein